MRGKEHKKQCIFKNQGITPAYAGKSYTLDKQQQHN